MRAEQAAEKAVEASSKVLQGTTRGRFRVDSVSWYGAVDIDTKHLVVWVLLSGAPDDELPKWYFPVAGQLAGIQEHLDGTVRAWLDEMRETVQHQFALVTWPSSRYVRVGFDSMHRVESEGGYAYFK